MRARQAQTAQASVLAQSTGNRRNRGGVTTVCQCHALLSLMLHCCVRSIALTHPTFRAIATTTPHHVNSHGAVAIEVAHDKLRWVSNRRGRYATQEKENHDADNLIRHTDSYVRAALRMQRIMHTLEDWP